MTGDVHAGQGADTGGGADGGGGVGVGEADALAGQPIDAAKTYKVAGWAPVAEEARSAPGNKPVWDVVEAWLKAQGGRVKPRKINTPKLVGVAGNTGIGA